MKRTDLTSRKSVARFTSLVSIIRRTFPRRTHRPGNVELRHLGEIARRNSRTDFMESLLGCRMSFNALVL